MPVTNPLSTQIVDRVGMAVRTGREASYGTPPDTLRAILKISESLKTNPERIKSEESSPDRMGGQSSLVGRPASGQVSIYLRYSETCFEFLEDVFWSSFDEEHAVSSAQITFASADNSITIDPIHPAVFTGSGLDDLASGGAYTGEVTLTFEVEIDAENAPDTFRWRTVEKDGTQGAWTSGVAITGAAQELQDGVSVTFGATTGHTTADKWEVPVLVFDDHLPYRPFEIRGAAQEANRSTFRVAESEDNTLTKLILEWGMLADEAAGATVELVGTSLLGPGTTRHSRTIEREYPDGTFGPYTGLVASSARLQANHKQFLRLDIDYSGRGIDENGRPSESVANTHLPAIDGQIGDMQNHLKAFRENGAVDGNIRNLEMSWNNTTRNQELAMQHAPVGVAGGTVDMTGTLAGLLFYGDDRLDRALGDQASDLAAVITTTEGTIIYQFLRFKFDPNEPTAESGEGDAELSLPFEAEPFVFADGSRAYVIVTKIPAAAP